jgi:spore coat protein U-like protein
MRRSSKIAVAVATVAAAALGVGLAPRSAEAATAASTFTVTANVLTACTIASTNITANYDPNATVATTQTGNVTLRCTRGTGYSVGLVSAHGWTMTNGADTLSYSILQGATTTPWTTASPVTGTNTGTFLVPINLVATLSIPPGQDVPGTVAGLPYTDTVTATVTF